MIIKNHCCTSLNTMKHIFAMNTHRNLSNLNNFKLNVRYIKIQEIETTKIPIMSSKEKSTVRHNWQD